MEYETQPIFSALDGMESEIHLPHVTRFHDTYVMLYDAMEPNHHTQTEVAVSRDGIRFRRVQAGVKLLAAGTDWANLSCAKVAAADGVSAPLVFHIFGSRKKLHAAIKKAYPIKDAK